MLYSGGYVFWLPIFSQISWYSTPTNRTFTKWKQKMSETLKRWQTKIELDYPSNIHASKRITTYLYGVGLTDFLGGKPLQ